MEKLNIKDIKLRSPGYYVRNEILQKYGSIDVFADSIGIYTDSVEKYLDSNKLGSATFKLKLVHCFDKGIDEIVVTKVEQIKRWVDNVTINLDMYKDATDIEVLQKIKAFCLKNKMQVETAKMLRNIGMNKFYNGKAGAAIELLNLSIEILENENKENLVFEYSSELGLVFFYESDYKKARETFNSISYIINKCEVSNRVLFTYYYRLGQTLRLLGRNKDSQEVLTKSLLYAENDYLKGNALMNIGIALKNENQYNKALEIYLDTYKYFDYSDNLSISILENNISELYKEKGDLDKALEYVNKALLGIGDSNIQKKFIYTQTYVQIKILQGEPAEAIQKLIDLIKYCKDRFLYRNHIIDGVRILIKYAVNVKNINIMKSLENEILKLINHEKRESRYILELKALLCDIFLYYRGKGVLI